MTLDQLANLIMPEWALVVCGLATVGMIIVSWKETHNDQAGLGYLFPVIATVLFFTYEMFFDGSSLLGKVFLRYIFLSFDAVIFIFRLHAMYVERKLKLPLWIARLLHSTCLFERRKIKR